MIDLEFLARHEEKIARSRDRLEKFWRLEDQKRTPVTVFVPGFYSLERGSLCTQKEFFSDKDLNLQVQLESMRCRLDILDDDYLPHLDTYMGTPVIASAFGGEVRYFEDQDPWIESPIIHDYRDIDRLRKPDPMRVGLTSKVLHWVDHWRKLVGNRLPLSLTDMQGPLSVAIDLMGATPFFLGLYDEPRRIKLLLEMISEVFIEFCNAITSRIESDEGIHEWTGIYLPAGRGRCRMSEDNLISISGEMYREFLMPYNELIFREVGGGLIHWCGDGSGNFPNVLATEGLTGIHNSSMGDLELILKQIEQTTRVNNDRHTKLVYFSSMKLPCRSTRVPELLERQRAYAGVLNFVFFPLDGYGLDFEGERGGYRKMEEDPLSVIGAFTDADSLERKQSL